MRRILVLIVALLLLTSAASAQQPKSDPFAPLAFLIGDWVGQGSGQPGQASAGGTTFAFDLQKHLLVRRNFSDYAATNDHPAFRHDDLMVIFEQAGALKAMYWDNEGHVIRYGVTSPKPGEVVFLSEAGSGPRFRLTYKMVGDKEHNLLFEIAAPGTEKFEKYVEGTARRK